MIYHHVFTVVGRVPFPVDMLRFDGCYPRETADAHVITASVNGAHARPAGGYRVTLIAANDRKHWAPTAARWSSFLWAVEKDSQERWVTGEGVGE